MRSRSETTGVIFVDQRGDFLLIKRNHGIGSRIETLGGPVSESETSIDAARRHVHAVFNLDIPPRSFALIATLPRFSASAFASCHYFYVNIAAPEPKCWTLPEATEVFRLPAYRLPTTNILFEASTRVALELCLGFLDGEPQSRGSYHDSKFVRSYLSSRTLTTADAEFWAAVLAECRADVQGRAVERILDLGAGTGRFLGLLKFAFQAKCVIGLDASELMARRAALTGESMAVGDALRLPFAPNSFDLVWSFLSWHHFKKPEEVCREISRVLSTSGRLFLRTWLVDRKAEGALFEYFPEAFNIQAARYPSKNRLLDQLRSAGLVNLTHKVIQVPVATTFSDYVRLVRWRAYSVLQVLSDDEYHRGLQKMEIDLSHGRTGPVYLPGDIIIAAKHADKQQSMSPTSPE